MLRVGDLVMYKPKGLLGWIISKISKSDYSHVAVVLGNNTIFEANKFIKSRIVKLDYDKEIHHIYRLSDLTKWKKQKIISKAHKYIGVKYDYLQVIGLFFRLVFNKHDTFNNLNKFICSEVIDKIYIEAGIKRADAEHLYDVTPQEILDKYDLHRVR